MSASARSAFLAWRLPSAAWVLIPLLYGGFLTVQEWRFRQALVRDVPAVVVPLPAQARTPLNAQAVATVLGLTSREAQVASAESISLQAIFVAGHGLSRALLADATGPRMYQVGERLPGGSVLRRVETDHVLLWRNGREERLALLKTGQPLLRRLGPEEASPATPHSTQYLRPVAGQAE